MKAILWTKYGPPEVLQLSDIEKPTPKDNEVLIRINATTVFAGDCEMRCFNFPLLLWIPLRIYMGLRTPRIKILGQELAGEVETVGSKVTQFKKGDQVFAPTTMRLGAYAEYICLPISSAIVIKPSNMTFEEAATVPVGGLNALYFIRKANVQSGETVLINGAGGSIGTSAVQIAKSYGAVVTAVDSAGKLDMLRSIGADHVIDYTVEEFTQNGETYDVIFDVVGKSLISSSFRSLNKNGRYILGNNGLFQVLRALWISIMSSKAVIFSIVDYKSEDLIFLKEMIEAGQFISVIDRRYPLAQIAQAHRYVESGQKAGNVVIGVEQCENSSRS